MSNNATLIAFMYFVHKDGGGEQEQQDFFHEWVDVITNFEELTERNDEASV